MGNSYFKFKQFTVNQSQCSMKVGTDGVLLGAWAAVGDDTPCRILDIGSGTGVVALIAAQRNPNAQIDAVEIDSSSAMQCAENFSDSLWGDRLRVNNLSIQHFVSETSYTYDYILSNPPYFNNSIKNEQMSKTVARHTDSLSYDELAECVAKLLSDKGVFTVIFPYAESSIFVALAVKYGLYCAKRFEIKGVPEKPVKRVLLQFTRKKIAEIELQSMDIETGERHDYSEKYIELTKAYYLKF